MSYKELIFFKCHRKYFDVDRMRFPESFFIFFNVFQEVHYTIFNQDI